MEIVKEYTIEKNEYVYEQIWTLTKSYTRWTDGDCDYVKKKMDEVYKTQGENALLDFFNKLFKDIVKVKWKN